MHVVNIDQLPAGSFSHELEGADHGGVGVSLIFTEAAPGHGTSLHRHDYVELHVVQGGEAVFTAGDEERVVRAGAIVVAAAAVTAGERSPPPSPASSTSQPAGREVAATPRTASSRGVTTSP